MALGTLLGGLGCLLGSLGSLLGLSRDTSQRLQKASRTLKSTADLSACESSLRTRLRRVAVVVCECIQIGIRLSKDVDKLDALMRLLNSSGHYHKSS